MIGLKIFFGYSAVLISLVSSFPYFRGILKGNIKPHAFSWFVWGVLTAIAFAAQIIDGGGVGAWIVGFTSLTCFVIFILALVKGSRKFPLFDWFALVAAGIALFLWQFTNDPTLSVILVTITDAIAYLPTIRKGYGLPYEESILAFGLSGVSFVLGLFALENYTISTWFYPAVIAILDWAFVIMLVMRRNVIGNR